MFLQWCWVPFDSIEKKHYEMSWKWRELSIIKVSKLKDFVQFDVEKASIGIKLEKTLEKQGSHILAPKKWAIYVNH